MVGGGRVGSSEKGGRHPRRFNFQFFRTFTPLPPLLFCSPLLLLLFLSFFLSLFPFFFFLFFFFCCCLAAELQEALKREELRCNLDARDPQGNTPIVLAIGLSRLECVQVLLEAGADLNLKTPQKWPPLAEAISICHKPIVSMVLRHHQLQVLFFLSFFHFFFFFFFYNLHELLRSFIRRKKKKKPEKEKKKFDREQVC